MQGVTLNTPISGATNVRDAFAGCAWMQGPPVAVYHHLTTLNIAHFHGTQDDGFPDDWLVAIRGSTHLLELNVSYPFDHIRLVPLTDFADTIESLVSLKLLHLTLPIPLVESPHAYSTLDTIFDLARGHKIIEERGGSAVIEGMNLAVLNENEL